MSYDRKIKYMDAFRNGEKIQNAGFVRLEKRDEKVSIQIHVSKLKHSDTCLCPITIVSRGKEVKLGEIALERGMGDYVNRDVRPEEMGDGIAYDSLHEVRVTLDGGVELRCVIEEEKADDSETSEIPVQEQSDVQYKSEAELLREAFIEERRMLERDALPLDDEEEILPESSEREMTMEQEENENPAKPAERPVLSGDAENGATRLPAENKWQQLWDIYPHITPFEDRREYLLVKPADFVILQEKYYSLVSNSFLLHGFYNYHHLVMVKESKKQGEKFYIGVPGNFYEKEKQVAVLFGFESFEGKYEPAGNGDFGYYMVGVEI